jgi:aspartate/methionine/tyrosine aminotransferase
MGGYFTMIDLSEFLEKNKKS